MIASKVFLLLMLSISAMNLVKLLILSWLYYNILTLEYLKYDYKFYLLRAKQYFLSVIWNGQLKYSIIFISII